MARRFSSLIAALMFSAVTLLAVGCTSSGSSTPGNPSATSSTAPGATDSPTATPDRQWQITLLFVQCLAQHNIPIWDKSQGNQNVAALGTKDGWYKNGLVLNNLAFSRVFGVIEGTYPIGSDFKPEMMVTQWIDKAVSTGTWPKVCGPLPSAATA